MTTIFIANYTHSLDVECILDDKYNVPAMMCHILAMSVFVPVVSSSRDDALSRIVTMLATEIFYMNDNSDDDTPVPTPAPTLETIVFMPDHEFSTPTTFVYSFDPNDTFSARIVVTELTID